MISDDDLSNLLNEIEEINNGQPLTYFEALTAAFFHGCKKYKHSYRLCLIAYIVYGLHLCYVQVKDFREFCYVHNPFEHMYICYIIFT